MNEILKILLITIMSIVLFFLLCWIYWPLAVLGILSILVYGIVQVFRKGKFLGLTGLSKITEKNSKINNNEKKYVLTEFIIFSVIIILGAAKMGLPKLLLIIFSLALSFGIGIIIYNFKKTNK